jgi:hypothetical protein
MKRSQKRRGTNTNKIKDYTWIAIVFILFGYLFYKIAVNSFTDHFLGDDIRVIKAVIIDDKKYLPNQPVKSEFTYSYQFTVNGQRCTGNSHDTTLMVGDSIDVKFNKNHPSINKPSNRQQ